MKKIIKLKNLNDAMIYAAASNTFRIRKGTLYEYGTNPREVYCIFLRGTNRTLDRKNVLSLPTCIKSCIGCENNYIDAVKKAADEKIPAGSSVMLIGHSLGGMVAQQFIADREIAGKYKLMNALTIGSPYVIGLHPACSLHRTADRADIVSTLSVPLFVNMFIGHIRTESGGYYFRVLGAHTHSYRYSPVWNEYDVFGVPYGRKTYDFEEDENDPQSI